MRILVLSSATSICSNYGMVGPDCSNLCHLSVVTFPTYTLSILPWYLLCIIDDGQGKVGKVIHVIPGRIQQRTGM